MIIQSLDLNADKLSLYKCVNDADNDDNDDDDDDDDDDGDGDDDDGDDDDATLWLEASSWWQAGTERLCP